MSDQSPKLDAGVGMGISFALLSANGSVDIAPYLIAHLVRCRLLAATGATEEEALREANAALDAARARFPEFDLILPFVFSLSTLLCVNFSIGDMNHLLDACQALIYHAEFTAEMRALLPKLRVNRELQAKLKGLTQ